MCWHSIEGQHSEIVKNDDVVVPLFVFEIRSIHYHLLFCCFSLSRVLFIDFHYMRILGISTNGNRKTFPRSLSTCASRDLE